MNFNIRKLFEKLPLLLPLGIVIVGLFLRLREYLQNSDLWLDEAMIGFNIVTRDFLHMFGRLTMGQSAPLGFLFFEKTMISLFGIEPLVYHFASFLASIAALLLLYWWLHKKQIPVIYQSILLFILAISPMYLRYTVETKQYMGEFFFTLLASIAIFEYFGKPTAKRLLVLFITFALLLVFSQSGILLFAALAPVLLYMSWTSSNFPPMRDVLKVIIGLVGIFLATFATSGVFSLGSSFLREYWTVHHGFLNISLVPEVLHQNILTLSTLFTLGGTLTLRYGVLFVLVLVLFRKKFTAVDLFFVFACVGYIFLATIKFYPIAPRISLFWAGLFLPILALRLKELYTDHKFVSFLIIIFLLWPSALSGRDTYLKVYNNEYYRDIKITGIRDVYAQLKKEDLSKSTIYVDGIGQNAHTYYKKISGLQEPKQTIFSATSKSPEAMLAANGAQLIAAKKIWIVFPYQHGLAAPVVELLQKNHHARLVKTLHSKDFTAYYLEIL